MLSSVIYVKRNVKCYALLVAVFAVAADSDLVTPNVQRCVSKWFLVSLNEANYFNVDHRSWELQRGTHYSMTTVLLVWSALLAYNCS
jgi:hypothetical protein